MRTFRFVAVDGIIRRIVRKVQLEVQSLEGYALLVRSLLSARGDPPRGPEQSAEPNCRWCSSCGRRQSIELREAIHKVGNEALD